MQLTLEELRRAMAGNGAALRAITSYEPAGGPGDKVFPPTYEKGEYATEDRHINGETVPCVLLDSVQSQANRVELALLEEWEDGGIPLPVITVDFTGHDLPKPFRVTSLEAPHRIADALLRDSELGGVAFRKSEVGRKLDTVDVRNATALFEFCPTALTLGMWDSTGEKGGLGAKFQRAMVSEIIGLHAQQGKRTSSRIDPAQIVLNAGPLYESENGGWTLDPGQARMSKGKPVEVGKSGKGKPGRPSAVNHGNVTPTIADGGFTISKAIQTTVLSLPALRRLRFPLGDERSDPAIDLTARTVLAAQALYGATLIREQGADLRSRCQLVATEPVTWELLGRPGEPPRRFEFTAGEMAEVYRAAVDAARSAGLPWLADELVLQPSEALLALVRKSQVLAVVREAEEVESA